VADLARLAALPAPQPGRAVNRIAAVAAPANLLAFRALLAAQTGGLPDAALWAAFAAGALRKAGASDAPVVIRAETLPGAPAATYRDPDLGPLSELSLADDAAPVLCIADGFRLTLTWPEGSLSTAAALATITGTARRIDQPLRHLL
jgi:hypothetical protein